MTELLWWHRPGVKVVCIRGSGFGAYHGLEKGRVYTVREAVDDEHVTEPSFRLVELVLVPRDCISTASGALLRSVEPVFSASRFRPVRETSIEQFNGLLHPTPEDEARYLIELAEILETSDA